MRIAFILPCLAFGCSGDTSAAKSTAAVTPDATSPKPATHASENEQEGPTAKLSRATLDDRLNLLKTIIPPTVECDRSSIFNFERHVPVLLYLGGKENGTRLLRYFMAEAGDEVTLMLIRPRKPGAPAFGSDDWVKRAVVAVDGQQERPAFKEPETSGAGGYLIPLSLMKRIGDAKRVTISAQNPDWSYELTVADRRGIADLAAMIEKVRAVK